MMWTPTAPKKLSKTEGISGYQYGLGWMIYSVNEKERVEGGRSNPLIAYHTGGTVGASSVLVIIPAPPISANSSSLGKL